VWHDSLTCVTCLIHTCDVTYVFTCLNHIIKCVNPIIIRSRGDQTLDIWISRFSWFSRTLFWVTETLFTHVKPCLKYWGLPRKRVENVRGLPWKLVGKFGSFNHFKADLLRPWIDSLTCVTCLIHICDVTSVNRIIICTIQICTITWHNVRGDQI